MASARIFFENHKAFCIATLGLGFLFGYIGPRIVYWILEKCGVVKKTDEISRHILHSTNPEGQKKIDAAIKIQRISRGYLARRVAMKERRNILSWALFEQGRNLIDYPNAYCPRAQNGLTPVYLPPDVPIVLKQAGQEVAENRLRLMRQARELCEKNNYSHLTIPRARVHKQYLIEDRVPFLSDHLKYQICLYSENREAFTTPIKELVGFCLQGGLPELLNGISFYNIFQPPHGAPRYDNIPLYYVKGDREPHYHIGLIDLEHFSPVHCGSVSATCRTLASLFPYHIDTIVEVGSHYWKGIGQYRDALEQESRLAIEFFQRIYGNHRLFLEKHQITIENPNKIIEISEDRKNTIIEMLLTVLRNEHQRKWWWEKGCLGDHPEEVLSEFRKGCAPQILEIVFQSMINALNKRIKTTQIDTWQDLILCRTITLNSYKETHNFLVSLLGRSIHLKESSEKQLVQKIINAIFKELENGGEIAYFHPRGQCSCIFC